MRELDSSSLLAADEMIDAAISNTYVRMVCSLMYSLVHKRDSTAGVHIILLTACAVLFEGFGVSFPGFRLSAVDVICDTVRLHCVAASLQAGQSL